MTMLKKHTYTVLTPLRHGTLGEDKQRISRTYAPGESVELDEDTAARLLAGRVITPAPAAQAASAKGAKGAA